MKTKRLNQIHPTDHVALWQAAADRAGMSLSAWMAKQCNKALPKAERPTTVRRGRGQRGSE